MPEPGAHVGGRGPAPRPRDARGGEQPAESGGTDLPDELVDRGRQPQLTVAREPIEELGHEGMEPLRPDAPGGLPEDLERLGHRRSVDRWPPRARARRRRPRGAGEAAGRRLAVQAGDGDDLVQEGAFLCTRRRQIALPLHRRVLPQAWSRHGLLPRLGMGNRDFGCTTSCSVTGILM